MTPIPTVRGEYFDVRRHNNRRRHRVARSTRIKIRWRCSRTQWQSSAQLSCMACVLSALAWTRSRREHTAERPRVRTSCRPARRRAVLTERPGHARHYQVCLTSSFHADLTSEMCWRVRGDDARPPAFWRSASGCGRYFEILGWRGRGRRRWVVDLYAPLYRPTRFLHDWVI